MADSTVKIANIALTKLGSKRIQSLTEDTEEAKAVNAVYTDILDELLCSHRWTFSQKRATLATLDTTLPSDLDGMTVAYAKPSDYIKMEMYSPATAQVKVESYGILSDSTGVEIIYTARVTDTLTFFPLFVQALATRLASEICYALTQSKSWAAQLLEDYEKLKLPRAKAEDSKQGTPMIISQDEWVNSRRGGHGGSYITNAGTWHPA